MGLPVDKFIAATNENDEFPKFLKTETYTPVVPSRNCSSNAMNFGHPSNLVRLIDHLTLSNYIIQDDTDFLANMSEELSNNGYILNNNPLYIL